MARVRISKTPKALSGLEIKMRPGLYGTNGNRQFSLPNQVNSQKFAQQPIDVRNTLQPVAREGANLEAEKGETALVNIDGIPAHFKIGGKRHSEGGTPLNLPDNSFIFSDTAKMKIKDPMIHAQFGMVPKKAGYTPAEIAKKFDINTFRKILAEPNSEDVERKTAEMMIANYNMKLAKLALVQESMKGFPQGIPAVAMPYIMANDIDPAEFAETQGQQEQPDADMGVSRYGGNMIAQFNTKAYGGVQYSEDGLPMGQDGFWSNVGQGVVAALEAPQRTMMWGLTGVAGLANNKGWTGEYEMPSETLNRNFPGHPNLAFAADLLADPFLVSGVVKGIARSGLKKVLAKEAADLVTTGSTKKLTGYEATRLVLRNAAAKSKAVVKGGKTIDEVAKSYETAKNLERLNAAIKAAEATASSKKFAKAGDLAKQSKMVQNDAIKAVGRVAQKQAAGTVGKGVVKAGMIPVKGVQWTGKQIYRAMPNVIEKGKKVVETIADANLKPLIIPALQTGEKIAAVNRYSKNNEDENQNLSVLKPKPKKPVVTKSAAFVNTGTKSPEGYGLFIHPSHPGKKFVFSHGSYITYNPTGIPQGPPKPKVQMNTESDASWNKKIQVNLDEYEEINP